MGSLMAQACQPSRHLPGCHCGSLRTHGTPRHQSPAPPSIPPTCSPCSAACSLPEHLPINLIPIQHQVGQDDAFLTLIPNLLEFCESVQYSFRYGLRKQVSWQASRPALRAYGIGWFDRAGAWWTCSAVCLCICRIFFLTISCSVLERCPDYWGAAGFGLSPCRAPIRTYFSNPLGERG